MTSGGKPGELSTKQQRAIAALLCSRDVPAAAALAKVGARTLYRWIAEDDAFRAALTVAEGAAIDAATRRLLGLQESAIATLEGVLDDADASPSARVRAAGMVIDYLLKLRELRNVESRLAALEQALEGGNSGRYR
jgi:hypothetical protein